MSRPATPLAQVPAAPRAPAVPYRRARRWLFGGLVLATTALGSVMMLDIVRAGGVSALEVGILALFVPTFAWISVAFWNALVGFVLQILRVDPNRLTRARARPRDGGPDDDAPPLRTRTALVIPARHEEPTLVLAGVRSMLDSLEATGEADRFDVHLLSDTTDAAHALREEQAWRELVVGAPRPHRLHYRRRSENVGRKAGNIADFCRESGDDYDFMVVLDADSVMSGPTLVRMARAMEADPEAGLVQTVPIPARQQTLFGRLVQFAASVYSPMLATGQAFWQTDSANYWGHNAIVRLRPFREHCELPVLPGRPPLGGAVLSHDFVEAALLRRAGWGVWLDPSLGGSYEGVPANVPDYATRDRRWAQGSLQHLRLLGLGGLHPLSPVHFAFGAMGYVSSVLWLLLLLASTVYVLVPSASEMTLWSGEAAWLGEWSGRLEVVLPLLGLTAAVLFVPKLLGLVLAALRRPRAFGSRTRLAVSGVAEALFSVLVAPLMMMYHAAFVVGILAGRDVEWGAQVREDRSVGWSEALRRTAPITALGALWAGLTLYASPLFFLWLTPIFAGLLLAAPIVRWTSSARLGRWLRGHGLLLAPSETDADSDPVSATVGHQIGDQSLTFPDSSGTTLPIRNQMHQIERGLFELRRGRPLLVTGEREAGERHVLFTAVEGLDGRKLDELRALGEGAPRLVVTPLRAKSMGVESDGLSGDAGVSLSVNGSRPAQLFAMASAIGRLDGEALGARPANREEEAALALVRLSGLVPAAVAIDADPERSADLGAALESRAILSVRASEVRKAVEGRKGAVEITHVSNARVPLEDAEDARFMLFREASGLLEHVAILFGDRRAWPDVVPVRLHSACLTGDLFGSLRCDCGEQLRRSMRFFSEAGGGVLLYLQQEGRGIGLGNKLRAYALQEQGFDTIDADRILGFEADERRYDAAVQMLHHLGVQRVKLLTNNPDKVHALESGGIRVVEREPLHGTLNDHNRRYVHAKVHRAGHWLHEMLQGAFPRS